MVSPLEKSIIFLESFGFFDVVLPFLLVFTIVFAVLEKTKIFGTEGEDKKPKKNLNSMIAFVIALFVVATKEIVVALKVSLPQIAMFLIVIFALMMLMGFFFSGEKEFSLENKGAMFFAILAIIGVVLIFLNAFGWLQPLVDYVTQNWDNTLIVSLIFLIIIILTIFYIVGMGKKGGDK